jgi:hypothetical protein
VAALLQPSPEICNLFDNLVILSKGRVAYFGTYKNAIPCKSSLFLFFPTLTPSTDFARYGMVGGKFQSDPEFLRTFLSAFRSTIVF